MSGGHTLEDFFPGGAPGHRVRILNVPPPPPTTGFLVAGCERCGGVLRTDVVFFGDSVPAERVEAARDLVDSAGAVLVAGSSLAVRSALRWVRRAHADGKPVVLINRGPTRADDIAAVKVEASTSRALPWLAERLPSV